MAEEIGRLEIQIDSSSVKPAVADLDKLAGAAERAETATGAIGAGVAKAAPGIAKTGQAAALTGNQLKGMSFQINDIATSLASGASPFQVLAQQGGQVFQVLQDGPQGVGGSLKAIGSTIARMATSGVGMFGLLATAAAAFGLVVNKASSDTKELEKSLSAGAGRGAGLTVDGFRQISDAAAEAAGVSRSAARDIAGALAQTGRIGGAMFGDLITLTQRYAETTGQSFGDAGKDMAKAFADPAKGAQMFAEKLLALDGVQVRNIRNLAEQGRTIEAQQALARGLADGPLLDINKRIETLGDLWTAAGRGASNFFDNVVRGAGKLLSPSTGDQLASVEAQLAKARSGSQYSAKRRVGDDLEREASRLRIQLAQEEAQAIAKAVMAERIAFGQKVDAITASAAPIFRTYESLKNQQAALTRALAEGVPVENLAATQEALRSVTNELARFGDGKDLAGLKSREAAAAFDRELASIRATTEIERAAIAGRDAYAKAIESGLGPQRAKIEQDRAEARGLAELIANLDRQILAQRDAANASNIGAGVLGMGGGQAEAASAMREYNALAQLQREIDAASGAQKIELQGKYRELQGAIREATAATDAYNAAQQVSTMRDRLEMLQAEYRLLGASTEERYRAIEALKTEQYIRNNLSDTSGEAANDIRNMSRAVAEAQLRLDSAKGSADNFAGSMDRVASSTRGATEAQRALGEFATTGANAWANFATTQGSPAGTFTTVNRDSGFLYQLQAKAREEFYGMQRRKNISGLESSISSTQSNLDNILADMRNPRAPDAYQSKRADVFYDPNAGTWFDKDKQEQANRYREQLSTMQAQLATLKAIEAKLNPDEQATPYKNASIAYNNFLNKSTGFFDYTRGFATGGSFMVGGSGGTDSQMVKFKATPGERVTVETPGQRVANDNGGGATVVNNYNISIPIDASKLAKPGEDPAIVRRRMADQVVAELKRRRA